MRLMTTSSVKSAQPPPLADQRNTTDAPARPLTVVVGLLGLAKLAAPLTTLHRPPVPAVMALAASVVVVRQPMDWSTPALGTVGHAAHPLGHESHTSPKESPSALA